MDSSELLRLFADPENIETLSVNQRLLAGLITTILGMGITFVALLVLQFVLTLFVRLSPAEKQAVEGPPEDKVFGQKSEEPDENETQKEVVAAITTALALQLGTSVSNIVIRNIERVSEPASAWQKAGIAEQMDS